MYIRSGELVTILGVKWQIKSKLIKSLRSRLVLLIMITSILPCIVLKETLLKQYEENAVSLKSAEVQNQGTILCNQLSSSNYLEGTASEAINSEILQLSNIYNGRVMVIDSEYRIVKDTFGTEEGKTIISSDAVSYTHLVKGAAGQAVQNMNLMFGLPETTGLELVPMFP